MKILPVAKEMFLDYYYLKPLNQLTENFTGMFIGWSFRKLMGFLCVVILDAGHSRKYNHLIGFFFTFFVWIGNPSWLTSHTGHCSTMRKAIKS